MKVLSMAAPFLALLPMAFAEDKVKCSTKMGSSSVKHVHTVTHTDTILHTKTITKTVEDPTVTVHPKEKTSTVDHTHTSWSTKTIAKGTDTITVTSTKLSTIDKTTIHTTSITKTGAPHTVIMGLTATIPTSAGFTPVASALGDTYTGNLTILRRGRTDMLNVLEQGPKIAARHGKIYERNAKHPQEVICVKDVEETKTATHTVDHGKTHTVTAKAKTATVTVEHTKKETTTVHVGEIKTTLTAHVTKDVTSIATHLSTVIATTVTPTSTDKVVVATAYAACAANNVVSVTHNGAITGLKLSKGVAVTRLGTATSYECCVECITTKDCGASFWLNDLCTLEIASTCSPKTVAGAVFLQSNVTLSGLTEFTVSNGDCGTWVYGGKD